MAKRIESIDIFRGIAVLQMIFWQIFDFFSRTDIYEQSSPYFINIFNMPINGIGLALFTFASGASVYISITGKLKKNIKIKDIILHSTRRYGGYILLSLVFTTFVFGFNVFYTWKEAVQGIGFAALIAAMLILISRSKWFFAFFGVILAFTQPFLRAILENDFIIKNYPLEPVSFGIISNGISLFLNSTIRGFFSLTHALPMLLFGVALAAMMAKSNKEQVIRTSFLIGALMMLVSMIMHSTFNKINVYNWSTAYLIGFAGFSFLLFSLIEYALLKLGKGIITNFLSLFGKIAVVAYFLHFIIIYKPLKLLGIESIFNYPVSYLLTIISVALLYYICKAWLLNKSIILTKIRLKNK